MIIGLFSWTAIAALKERAPTDLLRSEQQRQYHSIGSYSNYACVYALTSSLLPAIVSRTSSGLAYLTYVTVPARHSQHV